MKNISFILLALFFYINTYAQTLPVFNRQGFDSTQIVFNSTLTLPGGITIPSNPRFGNFRLKGDTLQIKVGGNWVDASSGGGGGSTPFYAKNGLYKDGDTAKLGYDLFGEQGTFVPINTLIGRLADEGSYIKGYIHDDVGLSATGENVSLVNIDGNRKGYFSANNTGNYSFYTNDPSYINSQTITDSTIVLQSQGASGISALAVQPLQSYLQISGQSKTASIGLKKVSGITKLVYNNNDTAGTFVIGGSSTILNSYINNMPDSGLVPKRYVVNSLATKADSSSVYNKTQSDARYEQVSRKVTNIDNSATNYPSTSAIRDSIYTKAQITALLAPKADTSAFVKMGGNTIVSPLIIGINGSSQPINFYTNSAQISSIATTGYYASSAGISNGTFNNSRVTTHSSGIRIGTSVAANVGMQVVNTNGSATGKLIVAGTGTENTPTEKFSVAIDGSVKLYAASNSTTTTKMLVLNPDSTIKSISLDTLGKYVAKISPANTTVNSNSFSFGIVGSGEKWFTNADSTGSIRMRNDSRVEIKGQTGLNFTSNLIQNITPSFKIGGTNDSLAFASVRTDSLKADRTYQFPNKSGVFALLVDIPLVDTNVVNSAASLTLSTKGYYSFNGTTSTWTIPSLSGNTTVRYIIANMGSGLLTINAPTNTLWESGVVGTSTVLAPGETMIIYNNSVYWTVYN